MSNYGTAFASFYDSDFNLLYNDSGVLNTSGAGVSYLMVQQARGRSYWLGVGHGEFYLPPNADTYPLIQVGHYAVVYQHDAGYGAPGAAFQAEIACFLIRDIHVEVVGRVPLLKVSGPEVSAELGQWLVWQDVGRQAMVNQTIVSGVHQVGDAQVTLGDVTGVEEGDDVVIRHNTTLEVLYRGTVDGAPDPDTRVVGLTPPLYRGFTAAEVTFTATDYRTPTTQDIYKIMNRPRAYGGWSVTVEGGGEGTTSGTSHAGGGRSTLELLNDAAAISGEWWRLALRSAGNVAPLRALEWRKTADATGITLVMPDQTDAMARVTDPLHYGIIEELRREYSDQRLTHLVAYGGGGGGERVTLADADKAPPAGYTLTVNAVDGYAVLSHNALASAFAPVVREAVETFVAIQPSGTSDAARATAGNQLLDAAVQYMAQRNTKLRFYRVTCVLHKNVRPGQTINLQYADRHLTLNETGLHIIEVEHVVGRDNVRRTRLLVGEQLKKRVTGSDVVAGALRSSAAALSSLNAPAAGAAGVNSGGGHNPVTVAASSPPGALTVDADQALAFSLQAGDGLTAGGATLHVDLGTNSGLTFDAGRLKLGVPATLDAASLNGISGASHSHQIAAYSDGGSNPGALAKFSAAGGFSLSGIKAGAIESLPGQTLGVTADADLVLNPAGETVLHGTLRGSDWQSGATGMGLDFDSGALDARSVSAGTLVVDALVAAAKRAEAGALVLTKSASLLARDFTIPAAGAAGVLYLDDLPGTGGLDLFADGDDVALPVYRPAGAVSTRHYRETFDGYLAGANPANWYDTGAGFALTQDDSLWRTALAGGGMAFGTAAAAADFHSHYGGSQTGAAFLSSYRVTGRFRAGASDVGLGVTLLSQYPSADAYYRVGRDAAAPTLQASSRSFGALAGTLDSGYDPAPGVWHRFTLEVEDAAGETILRARFWPDGAAEPAVWQIDCRDASAGRGVMGTFGLWAAQAASGFYVDDLLVESLAAAPATLIGRAWGTVLRVYPGDEGPNEQAWHFTAVGGTTADGAPLDMGGAVAHAGTAVLDFGQSGDGYVEITTLDRAGSPYLRVATRGDNPRADVTVHTQHGQLDGIAGMGREWGLWAGQNGGEAYLAATDQRLEAHGMRLSLYENGGEAIRLDPAVPSIAVGAALPLGLDAGGSGFWVGQASGVTQLRIGGTSTGEDPRLVWDGASLQIRSGPANDPVLHFDSLGGGYFAGQMTIGAAGGIVSGATQLDSSGLRIGAYTYGLTATSDQKLRFVGQMGGEIASLSASANIGEGAKSFNLDCGGYGLNLDGMTGLQLTSPVDVTLHGDDLKFIGHTSISQGLHVGSLGVRADRPGDVSAEGGLMLGVVNPFLDDVDVGQLLSDIGEADYPFLVARAADVSHGMAELASTDTYAMLEKQASEKGGLLELGFTEGTIGWEARGFAAVPDSLTGTSAKAAVMLSAFKKLDANAAAYADTENILAVRNRWTTRLVLKGNGDLYVDGGTVTFDAYDDAALVRALDLATAADVDATFDAFVRYRRDDLVAAGLLSPEGMVNLTRLQRLHNGAIWQLHERIAALEARLNQGA